MCEVRFFCLWGSTARGIVRLKKVVGEAGGRHVQSLKAALADAQQKMAEHGELEPADRLSDPQETTLALGA